MNQIFIIGGGYSIKELISQGFWSKLEGRFTLGCNYLFQYFETTALCGVDRAFYTVGDIEFFTKEQQLQHKEALNKLPLIINQFYPYLPYTDNTIPLPVNNNKYYRNIKLGCWAKTCGSFALAIAIYLLDVGNIFLLGFDSKHYIIDGQKYTHFYRDIRHRGVMRPPDYNTILGGIPIADVPFLPFKEETKCKIYNVCPESNLSIFPKINYEQMLTMLDNETYHQEELRDFIRRKLI